MFVRSTKYREKRQLEAGLGYFNFDERRIIALKLKANASKFMPAFASVSVNVIDVLKRDPWNPRDLVFDLPFRLVDNGLAAQYAVEPSGKGRV